MQPLPTASLPCSDSSAEEPVRPSRGNLDTSPMLMSEADGAVEASTNGVLVDTADHTESKLEEKGEDSGQALENIDNLSKAELRQRLWESLSEVKEKASRVAQLQATIRELTRRMSEVSQFIDMREDIEERLETMQREHKEEVEQYKSEAKSARLEMLENRVRLRALEEEARRQHEVAVDQRASELLDQRTRDVNNQNFDLLKDKVLLVKDVEAGRAEVNALSSSNATLRQQYDLAASRETEMLSRSVGQKKQIALLKKQIKESEDAFTKVTEEYEDQLATADKAHRKQVAELTRERDEARNDAKRLQLELRKLRAASTRLVKERGELEQFFYEALADVRAKVLAERRQALLMGMPSATSNRTFSATQTTSSTLRLDTQRHRLQLTDGKSSQPSSSFHNAANTSRRVWGTNSKGLPVLLDNAKISGKALPPIPAERAGGTGAANIAAGTSATIRDEAFAEAAVDSDVCYSANRRADSPTDATMSHPALSSIPDAPTWKEVQSVDIRDLGWADKERVIRVLFKRLRQQQQHLSSRRNEKAALLLSQEQHSESLTTSQSVSTPMSVDDDVFLTQQ